MKPCATVLRRRALGSGATFARLLLRHDPPGSADLHVCQGGQGEKCATTPPARHDAMTAIGEDDVRDDA
jgi:hypothetical protein